MVSGELQALSDLLSECAAEGVRARQIPVDYAAHSTQVQAIREELLEACDSLAPTAGEVPFYSSVTGEQMDTAQLDAEYWYRNLRETVRFDRVTEALWERGCRTFIEVSPHPVLTTAVQETIERALGDGETPDVPDAAGGLVRTEVSAIGSLRREDGGPRRMLASLGEAWVRGVDVDWRAIFGDAGARRVRLPTYAFQRERYWSQTLVSVGDFAAAGQASAEHPLLAAAVGLATDEGWLFTGRLSLQSHPWLADHEVMGAVLLPGAAFVELALHAGGQLDCGCVRELLMQEPLVLREGDGVQVQVVVGGVDGSGRRPVAVYSRVESRAGGALLGGEGWVGHATGELGPVGSVAEVALDVGGSLGGVWPPAGAEVVGVDGVYDALAGAGLEYGPVFQGLRGVWRRGEEVFAEVALAREQEGEAGSFGVHPVLLDAALHALAAGGVGAEVDGVAGRDGPRLPFVWGDVVLGGAGASVLRVRLRGVGDGAVSLVAVDEGGGLVASVGSLVLREAPVEWLGVGGGLRDSLFGVDWVAVASEARESEFESGGGLAGVEGVGAGWTVLSCVGVDGAPRDGEDVAGVVCGVLGELQQWLSDERSAGSRLVVLTRGAVDVDGGGVTDLAGGAVWGLVRAAQAEHPGRFVLVDVDGEEDSRDLVARALELGESEVAVRGSESVRPAVGASGRGDGRRRRWGRCGGGWGCCWRGRGADHGRYGWVGCVGGEAFGGAGWGA